MLDGGGSADRGAGHVLDSLWGCYRFIGSAENQYQVTEPEPLSYVNSGALSLPSLEGVTRPQSFFAVLSLPCLNGGCLRFMKEDKRDLVCGATYPTLVRLW